MEEHVYADLAARQDTYFWNAGRREILREALRRFLLLPRHNVILDIGCGTGANIHLLKQFGDVTGLDIAPEALRFARQYPFSALVQGNATLLPFPDASFSLASALDVLEHIDDDRGVMKEVFRVLKPGGIFLITVPMYPWLFSQHDRALHHVRRYRRKEILEQIRSTGFEVNGWSHFVVLAVFFSVIRKCVDWLFGEKHKEPVTYDFNPPPWLNAFFLFVLRCEKALIRFFPLPLGTSLFIVAKKPKRV